MIILDDKYVVDANSDCYTLKMKLGGAKTKDGKVKVDKNGNPEISYSTVGYYTQLHDVFRAWYNALLKDSVKNRTMGASAFVQEVQTIYVKVCRAIEREIPDVK